MLNRKMTAILLAAAVALTLCGVSVFAADPVKEDGSAPAEDQSAIQTDTAESAVSQDIPREDGDAVPEEGGETQQGASQGDASGAQSEGEAPEEPEPTPDPAGTISFDNLDRRVRAGNLNSLFLQENISIIEVIDYDKLKEDLRKGLNDVANAHWELTTGSPQISTGIPGMEGLDAALQSIAAMSTSTAAQSLQAQYDTLREKFDDLKKGKLQAEAADQVRQLRDAQDSIVMVAEGMYIQLSELRAADEALERSLNALDRQIVELELRYKLGQISAMQLQQAKAGRTTLVSKRETLSMSAQTLAMNLEAMVGADLTGTVQLTALPTVSAQELEAMNLENDLAAAKEASFELYDARKTLDDAQEDFKDAGKEYNYNEKKYEYLQAQHTWQGAQYTYQSAVQTFELKFRALYAQVKDYAQALTAAQTALAVEQDNYGVDQLKYEQGTISKNALLTAEDDLNTARDTVATAERNLFSAYNDYRWAVDHGILN